VNKMKIPLLDLKRQYKMIKEEVDFEIEKVLSSAHYINGLNVKSIEEEIAGYVRAKHAISVANGTDALVIALEALGIGEGDEVITTTWSFFATAEAIAYVKATPVFVDINLDDFNIDVSLIEGKITEKTKAILPVHIFGNPCDIDKINEIAKRHKLYVIEDAAQAIGSKYKGKQIGSTSDITTFSFFPTKNLGAYGDGGMITTNSDELASIIRAIKAHGSGANGEIAYNLINGNKQVEYEEIIENQVYNPKKYYNYLIGHNSRLDEIQAAVLRVKLKYLDSWNIKRNEIAFEYDKRLQNVVTPSVMDYAYSCYHLYILQSDYREKLIKHLSENGISTGVYYPVPLHLQKAFANLGYKVGDCPNAEYLSNRTFAIPAHETLTKEEQEYIINIINEVGV